MSEQLTGSEPNFWSFILSSLPLASYWLEKSERRGNSENGKNGKNWKIETSGAVPAGASAETRKNLYQMMSASINQRRAALVVAHPSHELRVHGWLQMCHPWVLVLTDGSGRTGEPRLLSTRKV